MENRSTDNFTIGILGADQIQVTWFESREINTLTLTHRHTAVLPYIHTPILYKFISVHRLFG